MKNINAAHKALLHEVGTRFINAIAKEGRMGLPLHMLTHEQQVILPFMLKNKVIIQEGDVLKLPAGDPFRVN